MLGLYVVFCGNIYSHGIMSLYRYSDILTGLAI